MFSLKRDFRDFATIRKTSNRAKKANRSRNTLTVSFVCSRSSQVDQQSSSIGRKKSCVLSVSYRSYPGRLRSFKRRGYLEVRRQKSRLAEK